MKNFLIIIQLFLSSSLIAQTLEVYTDETAILFSDANTKSVLLDNLNKSNTGNFSPRIGAFLLTDSLGKLQNRSLLKFDYGTLPQKIMSWQIKKATLTLFTLETIDNTTKPNTKYPEIMVRRVAESWHEDSVNWFNQPSYDKKNEVEVKIRPIKNLNIEEIDVTRLVREMFKSGNNGFVICEKDSSSISNYVYNWFGSAKNKDKRFRPVLKITYSALSVATLLPKEATTPPLPLTARDKAEIMQIYFRPEDSSPNAPAPVKVPVKD